MNGNSEPVDLELLAKENKPVPKIGPYRIRVNGVQHVVPGPTIKVEEIIVLAKKSPPEQYAVFRRIRGHQDPNPIPLGTVVDLREPGVEQFLVLPRVQPDGYEGLRRQLVLSQNDMQTVENLGLPWETVAEGAVCRLILRGVPLPLGYTTDKVDLNIRLEAGYPDTALDMAYFHPPLERKDGRPIPATSADAFDGLTWQRWSRHRTESDKWVPGVDDLATHLACIRFWLEREATR